MRRKPTQARSRKKVERILDATAALVDRDGPATLTTNAIAKEAGVPIGTLYQFFPNKREILSELLVRQLGALDARFEPFVARALSESDLDPVIDGAIDTLAEAYVEIPALATLVQAMRADPEGVRALRENRSRIEEMLVLVLRRGTSPGRARAVARMLVEATDGVLQHWLAELERGDRTTLNELKAMVRAYLRSFDLRELKT